MIAQKDVGSNNKNKALYLCAHLRKASVDDGPLQVVVAGESELREQHRGPIPG